MAIICVADGDCTTWAETIPASAAVGFGLPFENIDPDSNISNYDIATQQGLTVITIDDFGGGVYSVLIEDPFQSGLVSSPQGAPNNLLGAVPDCLDGTDPDRLFLWDFSVEGSSARNWVFRQSQVTIISTGVSGVNGAFIAIRVDTNLPFPPSSYPYLTALNLSQWVAEFGNLTQVGLIGSGNEITLSRAACSTVVATNISVASTGATTWDFEIQDPYQANLVSDPDDDPNNTNGSILDCIESDDPDATLTMGFTILGAPYQVSIPVTMITGTVTSPNLDGADLVISIDTSLPFTTADLANTLQANLNLLDGVTGYPTFSLLRCDTIDAAERIVGTGTIDDPLIPNVVLHPDGSIVCGPDGLELAANFSPAPQGPTSSPLSGTPAFPPAAAGCANWICETPDGDWYAPEHSTFIARGTSLVTTGITPTLGLGSFVLGSANNHILNFQINNNFDRPIVPRIICRAQSQINNPAGTLSVMVVRAQVTESWTGNVYEQSVAFIRNMDSGGAAIEDEKSTTFVFSTTGGIYNPAFPGYQTIPNGEFVNYDVNVGHVYDFGPAPTWARSIIIIEAALFTSA